MRGRRVLVGLLLVIVVVAVAGGAVGSVAADHRTDDPTPSETPASSTPTPQNDSRSEPSNGSQTATATPEENGSETPDEVVEQVDSRLRVVSYNYNEDEDVVTVKLFNVGGETSEVTITEAISERAADSGRFGIRQLTVEPGETLTVTISTYTDKPLGVMITTSESVESGHGTFLPFDSGFSLFSGSATWNDVRAGIGAAIFGCLLLFGLVAWNTRAKSDNEVEDVDVEGSI